MAKEESATTAVVEEEVSDNMPQEVKTFTCVRCGFQYQKGFDYEPHLCNRCIRYLAKGVWKTVHQLQPATSTPAPSNT